MTTELALVAKATVILGIALAATRIAHRTRASVRALILASAFGLLLVMPAASALAPPRDVQIPVTIAPAFLVDELSVTQAEIMEPMPRSPQPGPAPWWRRLTVRSLSRGAWLLGTVATLLPLALGLWRVRTLRRRGCGWAAATACADELRAVLGLRRAVTVVLHNDVSTPVTCGWFRPTIVMPIDAPDWPADDLRQALLHELEHVRRHDWPVHILARLTCALYWFHPVAWIAWRQLSLESERACDDAVVSQAENTAYAQQLVALARRVSTGRADPLLSMADRRTLATRVASILGTTVSRGRAGSTSVAATVASALALSAILFPLQVRAAVQPVRIVEGAGQPAPNDARGLQTPPIQGTPPAAEAFEVASIRRNTSSRAAQTIDLRGNTFVAQNVTVRDLLLTALRVRPEQLSGGPGWLASERYDVLGRPRREASWDEHLSMVQTLLRDRFKLSMRRERREAPAYALVVSRSGSRLAPAADADCTPSAEGPRCGGFTTRPGSIVGRRVTIAQVATLLSGRSGRLVVNRTGIDGFFDVQLSWTPDASQLPPGPPPDDVPPFDPNGPSLFAAIQEQLGLRLEPTSAAMDHFVIERIERPTLNDAPELAPQASQPTPQTARPPFAVASPRGLTGAFDLGLRWSTDL